MFKSKEETSTQKIIEQDGLYIEQLRDEVIRLNNIINELEKYIVNEINNANKELNVIMKGNDLAYKNECSKEFNCIKKFVDKTLDKLQELKEGK